MHVASVALVLAAPPVLARSTATQGPSLPAPEPDHHAQRVARLREQIESILHSPPLSRLRVGVEVMNAESGDVLLAHNAAQPFNPASNTKILTTAAALKVLGSDWRYRTMLLARAPGHAPTAALGTTVLLDLASSSPASPALAGVIHGDLFLQGSGDPSLTTSGLAQLARNLSRSGITRIQGDLLVDNQFRAMTDPGGSASGTGALIVNRNAYAIHVSPETAGHPASTFIEPRAPYFILENHVQTARGKRGKVVADAYQQGGHLHIAVRGRIGEHHGEIVLKRHLGDGGAFAAATLGQALSDFGITLTGQVRIAPPPTGPLMVVAEHQSSPLSEVCWLSNKDSNNFVADTIFKTLGGERFGLPGTLQKGARAVGEWLGLVGIDPARIHIVNGSGLTHENRVRPEDLIRLLRSLYHDIQLAPEFLQSLAVGGIDGTIRGRFHGPTVGLVRAKTGTLSGVSALSGYVGQKQDVLVFSILVEGFGHKRLDQVRHAQDLIVESLLRFLRGDAATPASPPAVPGKVPEPGSESGDEDESDPA